MTRRRAGPVSALVLLLCTAGGSAVADVNSDLFQPDVFHTEAALRHRTPGFTDPRGRDCALPVGVLSLAAAIDLALCRNPTTRAAWAAAHSQAAALGSAESAWLPTVTATGGDSRYFGEHVDVTGAVASGDQTTRDVALNLSWTLYDFGGRSSHIRSARYLLDAAAAGASWASQQVVAAAVQAYYGVIAGDATLLAAQDTEASWAQSLEIARALRSGGVATLADVLQAETASDQAVLTRVQADASAKAARGSLAVVIGSPADQALKVETATVPAEVPALNGRMAALMAEAMRQRPDLAAALARRDSAEADVTVARALGRPVISFGAGRNAIDTVGIANQNYSTIGINITVPLFSGFNTGYGVRQAQALVAASEANADQIRLAVSLDVWNAYASLDSANQQIGLTAALINTAQNNQQVALGRYKSGVGTIIDVLTAQSAAASARLVRINAEYGWQVARVELALALGRLSGSDALSEPALP
jgi:outer membrane protein